MTAAPRGRFPLDQPGRGAWCAAALFLCAFWLTACASSRFDPYSPHETLLGIAAEYKLLEAGDPYRDPPGRDLAGQHIARSTLVRLANYEALHPGRFELEILALRARCYERLGDLDTARALHARCAAEDWDLAPDARHRVEMLDRILAIRDDSDAPRDVLEAIVILEEQADRLHLLARDIEDREYRAYALIEAENAEVRRTELLVQQRWLLAGGEEQAVEAARQLLRRHEESRRAREHALRLVRLHRELAEEEAALRPPETLDFDRARFEEHLDAALEIATRLSQEDGHPERLVAGRELEALLALREWVARRAY